MPTYEYACRDCGEHLEVVQSFRDDPLTTCSACDGRLRKVFSAAGIIFKGSGYYVTDTRAESAKTADKPSKAADDKGSSDAKSSDGSGGSSGDSTSSSDSGSSGDSGSSSGTAESA